MALTPDDYVAWIARCETNAYPSLYFLGIADRRITFYSQQVRALHLVHALEKVGRLKQGQNVAVIGGGAAGVSAAMAAALAGAHVVLFEQTTDILYLQGGSGRLLHPHIYEWPARGSLDSDAVRPILAWSANLASEVVKTIKQDFASVPPQFLKKHVNCPITSLTTDGVEWTIPYKDPNDSKDPEKIITGAFHHVILAMGFGEEKDCGAAPRIDYWRDQGPASAKAEPSVRTYFVSGNGDGGLTDALAVLIRDFNHQAFTEAFLARIERGELAAAVDAARAEVPDFGADLGPAFAKHVLPVLEKRHLVNQVRDQLRKDRQLVLNATPLFGKDRAASLNQVMVLALIEAARTTDGLLTLSGIQIDHVAGNGKGYDIIGPKPDYTPVAGPYDEVVLRHGPEKADRYAMIKPAYDAYCAHYESLCASDPVLRDPPRLHPETFDHFDAHLTETASPSAKAAAKQAAVERSHTICLAWDLASQGVIERGSETLLGLAAKIDTLTSNWTIVLADKRERLAGHVAALLRLKAASNGKLRLLVDDAFQADWASHDPDLSAIHVPPSPYPPEPISDVDALWDALDACLLRHLDAGVADAANTHLCPEMGPIHSTIAAGLSVTWADWRSALNGEADLRRDFLRLLHRVELAGKDRWDGESGQVGRLVAGLVLMLAAHEGETLLPARLPQGNLQFADKGVALGSGCAFIDGKRIGDYGDPAAWDVDALILSNGEEGMFAESELMTEAGEPSVSLTRARRLAPVVIPGSRRWRILLGGDIADWRGAVRAEFDKWRARQKQAVGEPHA